MAPPPAADPSPALALARGLLVFAAALFGGAVNSIAGGGSLFTFSALVAVGVPPVVSNATSTVALLPGSIASLVGYRGTLGRREPLVVILVVTGLVGGVAGATLLLRAGDALFAKLVPWLILGATLLFAAQGRILSLVSRAAHAAPDEERLGPARVVGLGAFQLFVATYGGFFGAGMGILMLGAFGVIGLTSIHRMNALKHFAAVSINSVAAVTFVAAGTVRWPEAALMTVAAVAGGYGGARLARRTPVEIVRRLVILVGLAITAVMFWRVLGGGGRA
jgi:uncharacterized membrane protein YfcA